MLVGNEAGIGGEEAGCQATQGTALTVVLFNLHRLLSSATWIFSIAQIILIVSRDPRGTCVLAAQCIVPEVTIQQVPWDGLEEYALFVPNEVEIHRFVNNDIAPHSSLVIERPWRHGPSNKP